MFANSKSILVQPIQRDDLIINEIDCRLIDVQQKVNDLLSAGYVIYDVSASTNSNFNNLIASSSGNRICIWKSVGSTAYTIYSTELASNGTNVIINATLNNMNQVTAIRDCKLTCSASSGLFANKAEFYGGDWYLASWTTGSNVKFTNCNVYAYSSEVYMPDVNFEYCNVNFKRSGTIAYSTYKSNVDTRFVNATTAGSTTATLTLSYAYTTDSDWFTRCTLVDWQNTGTAVLSSTASRTFNFTGLKIENSNLTVTNLYTTEGNKIYYEGQDLVLSASLSFSTWAQVGTTNISSSSGLYPSLAFNQSGIPYVAYQDNSTGGAGKATCMKYGSTGWQLVGNSAFSTGQLSQISLCVSSANDIIITGKTTGLKADAYYFNQTASSWNLLASAGYTTNNINFIKTIFMSNRLWSVVTNTSMSPYIDSYYMVYSSSASWNLSSISYGYYSSSILNIPTGLALTKNVIALINSTGTIDFWISNDLAATYIYPISHSIITDSNISYVDIYNKNAQYFTIDIVTVDDSSKTTVRYGDVFTPGATRGSTYLNIYGTTQFSTGTAKFPSIYNLNSIPYIVFQDTTGYINSYKYYAAASSWSMLGSAVFSTDLANRTNLKSDGTNLYSVVEEISSPGISLYKFSQTSIDANVNYTFENLETDIFDGDKTLDITTIQSTANYIVQNCKVSPGYNIVDTAVGRFIRNTYNINLAPGWAPPVDDALKETNADTFWVVKREDIEATLNGKIIKNLKLYDSGLAPYTYQSNDNFIIIANNASKGNAVFCFYNNKVKGTIFSDQYLDVAYTITDCIILMEPNEISELSHVVSSTALADGPLEQGNIVFNSFDNEIIS